VPSIASGSSGRIRIVLPEQRPKFDALTLEVRDPKAILVYEKRLLLEKESVFFQTATRHTVIQDKNNPLLFYIGATSILFDNNGILQKVAVKGKATSIKNYPFIDVKGADTLKLETAMATGKALVKKEGENFSIEVYNTKGFDVMTWTIKPSGELKLDYTYTLQNAAYAYAGIGMELKAEAVKSKRWLGEGPARIWKNRTQGGLYDVYAVDKQINIPGEVYNQPEFEGCFAPWKWAVFHLEDHVSIGFQNNSDVSLGVLNPVNGENAKSATWAYPKKEGIYFFNAISAVGSKWKKPTEFGPDAQPTQINTPLSGSVSLFVNWNTAENDSQKFRITIE
jgi:hypothetical protein